MPPPIALGQNGRAERAGHQKRNPTPNQENFLKALAEQQERSHAHSTPLSTEQIHQGEENKADAAADLMKELMSQAPPIPEVQTPAKPVISKTPGETPPAVLPIQDLKNTTKDVSQEQVNNFMKNMSEGLKATVAKIKSFGKKVIETISAGKFWDRVFGS